MPLTGLFQSCLGDNSHIWWPMEKYRKDVIALFTACFHLDLCITA